MTSICKYFSCIVAKITGRDCADYRTCQANKFYERYGEDYMSLGVGAMMVPIERLSDKGIQDEVDSQKSQKA